MSYDDEMALHTFLDDILPCLLSPRRQDDALAEGFIDALASAYGVAGQRSHEFDRWLKEELGRRAQSDRLRRELDTFTSSGLRRLRWRLAAIGASITSRAHRLAIVAWARRVRDDYGDAPWRFSAWCDEIEALIQPFEGAAASPEPRPPGIGATIVLELEFATRIEPDAAHSPLVRYVPSIDPTLYGFPALPRPALTARPPAPRVEDVRELAALFASASPAAPVVAPEDTPRAPRPAESPAAQDKPTPADESAVAPEPVSGLARSQAAPEVAPAAIPTLRPPRDAVEAVAASFMQFDEDAIRFRVEGLLASTGNDDVCRGVIDAAPSVVARSWTTRLLGHDRRVGFVDDGGASDVSEDVWFAGDIHGDLLSLALIQEAFARARREDPGLRLVFLGDFVDRGVHDAELILGILAWMREAAGDVGWIAGNHDLYLEGTARDGFTARVSPASFVDWLNGLEAGHWGRALGETFVGVTRSLPRALFLPGLLATHGGFPHVDTLSAIHERRDLESGPCLGDFTNNRVGDKRKSHPNRASHGSQFGYNDFFAFCQRMHAIGLDVEQMVRGHDHVDCQAARWERLRGFGNRVLTINSLSYNQEPIFGIPPDPRWPTIAVWTPRTRVLQPIELRFPSSLGEWYAQRRERVPPRP